MTDLPDVDHLVGAAGRYLGSIWSPGTAQEILLEVVHVSAHHYFAPLYARARVSRRAQEMK